MSGPGRVAVVGASLAGVRVVRALRRKGFDGELVLVGEEGELPYDRPPLSKQFLTAPGPVSPRLLEPEGFYDGVELRLGVRAVGLRPQDRALELSDGTTITADHVVVATGAAPRPLPGLTGVEGVAVLRTAEDARRLRAQLGERSSVAIVGGGFIGCEVAASARQLGLAVTVIEALPAPVVRGVGGLVGGTIAGLHREHGVDMRLGVSIRSVEADDRIKAVILSDGSRVETDFVVVGIGAVPATSWLEGSGLDIRNGIACDDRCQAVGGGGGVWAAGDVAAWPSQRYGGVLRLEHWTNAAEQASVLAANILDGSAATHYDPVPYVWSDQYGHKFQIVGLVSGEDDVTLVQGEFGGSRFAAAYSRGGRLRGMVACDLPQQVVAMRPLIAASAPLAEAG